MFKFLQRLFGRKKKKGLQRTSPSTQDMLQKLQETEDLLVKKQEFLERKIENELEIAKTQGLKNKRLALQALRRKKALEQQVYHIAGVLTTIQTQKGSLENASLNADILRVFTDAAKVLKGQQKEMDVDKVHDVMDDIAEQQEVASEIAQAIANPIRMIGGQFDVDEDELCQELQQINEEGLTKRLLELGPTERVSAADSSAAAGVVPSTQPVYNAAVRRNADPQPKKKTEDEELAELEKWAGEL